MPYLRLLALAFLLLLAPFTITADDTPAKPAVKADAPAKTDATPAVDDVSIQRMKKDIFFLAGDDCEGRGLKTQGIIKAGDYIAASFKESGLKPAGDNDSFFQHFTVQGGGKLQPGASVALAGPDDQKLELKIGTDCQPMIASATGKKTAEIVFAGYGVRSKEQNYDDYEGIDVKGKIVMILRRTPRADDKKKPFDPTNQAAPLAAKVETALDRGAAGILFVSDRGTTGQKDPLMEENRTGGSHFPGPVVHIKRAVADKLLASSKKTLEDLEQAIDETGKPQSFAIKDWSANTDLTVRRIEFPTRNVVGVLPGAGPLADETIVIGAHYDHLGNGDEGNSLDRKPEGKAHYGADDNASGTTGLLEMARRLGGIKDRQGRRIVFIAFSGEEKGLFGSLHYVKKPTFPIEKTTFMLNMDMIGRMSLIEDKDDKKKRDRLVVYGTGTAPELDKLVDEITRPYDFKLFKIPGGSGPSDHTSFYAKKIPVLFFFTGTHVDYHKPSDTPDKINLIGMKKIVDVVEKFATHFATVEKRPTYVATKGGSEDPTNPSSTPMIALPRIGIMPGNYGEADGGVLVEAVMPDSPAAKAGVKEGDRIVDINGKAVKNMSSYMSAMGAQKPGVEIPVIVIREDKKVTVKVTPTPPR